MAETSTNAIARTWYAGEAGCGVLALGLKRELDRVATGEQLEVTALDAGAAADIPAWCRITGHRLEVADHPVYVVRKTGGNSRNL